MRISGFSKEYVAQTSVLVSHKVEFDSKGGTPISTKYIEHGQRILSHGTPYKEGATFLGWYWKPKNKDTGLEEAERLFDFSLPVESDLYLYAKWLDNGSYIKLEEPGTSFAIDVPFAEMADNEHTINTLYHKTIKYFNDDIYIEENNNYINADWDETIIRGV